jgi:hypothetical protein
VCEDGRRMEQALDHIDYSGIRGWEVDQLSIGGPSY